MILRALWADFWPYFLSAGAIALLILGVALFLRGALAGIWPYLIGAGAVALLLLGLYERGRAAGTAAAAAKDQRQIIKSQARVKNEILQADNARAAVSQLPSGELRKHDKYWRP